MKSFLNGLKKVFGFTVRHRLTKGWKTATLIVMLLCFALPLGIMSFWNSLKKVTHQAPSFPTYIQLT